MKLEQLRITPGQAQLFAIEHTDIRLIRSDNERTSIQADPILSALDDGKLDEAALLFESRCGREPVITAICSAAASATVTLGRVSDPEAPEVSWAMDLLEYAHEAARLWYIGDWKELSNVLVKLNATEYFLDEYEAKPNVPLADVQHQYPQVRPRSKEARAGRRRHNNVRLTRARGRGGLSSNAGYEPSSMRCWPIPMVDQQAGLRRWPTRFRWFRGPTCRECRALVPPASEGD